MADNPSNPAPSNLDQTGYTGALGVNDTATQFDVLSFIIEQMINRSVTVEPVIVQSVQADKLTVVVRPAVNQVDGQGNSTPHGQIHAIPYVRLQGGLAAAIVDPVAGDLGVMLVCARDISGVKSTKTYSNPGSWRRFDWADGLYIGGWFNPTPTTYVKIAPGEIDLVTPDSGTVTVHTGTLTVNALTHATVTSPHVDLISADVNLGNTGGKKVVLDGDPVVAGAVVASSTRTKAV